MGEAALGLPVVLTRKKRREQNWAEKMEEEPLHSGHWNMEHAEPSMGIVQSGQDRPYG